LTPAFAADASKAAQWRAFLRRNRLESAPADLKDVVAVIAEFLRPVAQAIAGGTVFQATWQPPGPWLDP